MLTNVEARSQIQEVEAKRKSLLAQIRPHVIEEKTQDRGKQHQENHLAEDAQEPFISPYWYLLVISIGSENGQAVVRFDKRLSKQKITL